MKTTKRHHYIPVFLSKHFSNEKGKLNVYNKTNDQSFMVSPQNIFLINDRNTFIDESGKESDVIEKIYASLDYKFSIALNEVKETGDLSGNNLKQLLLLAYTSKWRVPQYDESFVNAKNYFSVDDLGLGIKSDDLNLDIDLESIFETDLYQELKRFLLSIQPFRFKDDFKKIFENSFLLSSPYPGLIGDCPVNEVNVISENIFEDFILPITSELTLVYSQRIDKIELMNILKNSKTENYNNFIKAFSIARDLSTMNIAEQNVGCSNSEYLNDIVNNYKSCIKNDKIKDSLSSGVFTILYNYKQYFK